MTSTAVEHVAGSQPAEVRPRKRSFGFLDFNEHATSANGQMLPFGGIPNACGGTTGTCLLLSRHRICRSLEPVVRRMLHPTVT